MKSKQSLDTLLASLTLRNQAYINGHYTAAINGKTFPCINPATEALITDVASCDEADVNAAVISARASFNAGIWSDKHPTERKNILLKLVALIEQHKDEFALLDTVNMGKPISEMKQIDLPAVINCFQWLAEYIDKINGDIAASDPQLLALTYRQAVGVVACITPWNYPLLMAVWKIAPALAAGNSVILKPSEKAPLSALYLAQLASQAGIPDGVLNVIPGYGEMAGKALALHMDVDVISFTGSTKTAAQLMQYAGQSNLKRVWIEAGGKTPNIIFADCSNLKQAAATAAMAAFCNQGEMCIAASRLYVEKSIKAAFIAALLEACQQYQTGDPLLAETRMGPMVDLAQLHRVNHYIESALSEGGKLLLGGKADYKQGRGFFAQATIIDNASNQMLCVQEEIFGPVLTICEFETEQQAICLANDSKYGLAASIWTADLSRAHRVSRKINTGLVWVNSWGETPPNIPFGGIKASGNGRDNSYQVMEKYLESKTVAIRL